MTTRARREATPFGTPVLDVHDRPGPPPLRFEAADGGRLLLRQSGRPVLLGRLDGPNEGLFLHRLPGHRSLLPPIRADLTRSGASTPHRYAHWLEESPDGPLHDGRRLLEVWRVFPPYVWSCDFMRAWPGSYLDWCAGGWQGVVPLRPLSPPDAPRVRAYRRKAREGTLAPVLLWFATPLDGWLILDGHDRAVAALAEGSDPQCVILARIMDEDVWRRRLLTLTEEHGRKTTAPGLSAVLAGLPYETGRTVAWPLPGGAAAWDDLAGRAMFECPS